MSGNVITVLVDDPDSWIMPYVEELIGELKARDRTVRFVQHYSKIEPGDVAFFLSCQSIVPKQILSLNKHNLVVHESALPKGKGWSPVVWQVLNGSKKITVTLFEAVDKVDSGPIWTKESFELEGHELYDEINRKCFLIEHKLMDFALTHFDTIVSTIQSYEGETFFKKRTPDDNKLSLEKNILDQFNLLRIADENRYPAFFYHLNHKYKVILKKFDD